MRLRAAASATRRWGASNRRFDVTGSCRGSSCVQLACCNSGTRLQPCRAASRVAHSNRPNRPQGVLVANRRSLLERPGLLAIVHELIERFDAHLKAEQFYSGEWAGATQVTHTVFLYYASLSAVCPSSSTSTHLKAEQFSTRVSAGQTCLQGCPLPAAWTGSASAMLMALNIILSPSYRQHARREPRGGVDAAAAAGGTARPAGAGQRCCWEGSAWASVALPTVCVFESVSLKVDAH